MPKPKVYQMSPATITEVSGCWLPFEEVVPVEEEDNVSKPTRRRSISVMRWKLLIDRLFYANLMFFVVGLTQILEFT
jgi:hypothetical protein